MPALPASAPCLYQSLLGVLQAAVFTRGQAVSLEATGRAALSKSFQPAFDSAVSSCEAPLPRVSAAAPVQQSARAKALADYASAAGLRRCVAATLRLHAVDHPCVDRYGSLYHKATCDDARQ